MINSEYDDEELEILKAWDAEVLKPVKGMTQQIEAHRAVAGLTAAVDQGQADKRAGRVAPLNIEAEGRKLRAARARAQSCGGG
jgi:hypothetical protein